MFFWFGGVGFELFFYPSFSVSPLSLLLFRLVAVSISSGFLISFFEGVWFLSVFVVSFFFFPRFTKVHPSSLSGLTSASGCVLFFVFASVIVVVSVVVVVSLVAVVVLLVAMVSAF